MSDFYAMAGETDDFAPKFAPFLGMAGVAFAMIFGCTHRFTQPNRYRDDEERVY